MASNDPPMPAVTKHRSVPSTMACTSLLLSSAAFLPISGIPPAPSPLVTSVPTFRTLAPLALDRPKAWASVFTAQNSTPSTRVSIILSTALEPPPPTPITFITQGDSPDPPSGIIDGEGGEDWRLVLPATSEFEFELNAILFLG